LYKMYTFIRVSIPHRYDTNPKKALINQHMEKLYNAIIYPFENSVNTLYLLILLKNSQKTSCRRSPGFFARLGVDDSCEMFHFPFIMRNMPNPCEFRPPMPTRYKNVKFSGEEISLYRPFHAVM